MLHESINDLGGRVVSLYLTLVLQADISLESLTFCGIPLALGYWRTLQSEVGKSSAFCCCRRNKVVDVAPPKVSFES